MIACVALGQLFDSLGQPWLRTIDYLWARIAVINVLPVATVCTVGSVMLPSAYFGTNILDQLRKGGSIANDCWGQNPELAVFLLTSFLAIPAFTLFGIDTVALNAAHPMTRSQAVWSALALWFSHGGINALHVKNLRNVS